MKKGDGNMSTNNSNHLVNPAAREAMDKFKMEAAADFRSPIHLKTAPFIPLKKTVYNTYDSLYSTLFDI